MLLSGPPGIGKTSSAHVVAKEAGYEVIEFNASDVRSKKSLEVSVHSQPRIPRRILTSMFVPWLDGAMAAPHLGLDRQPHRVRHVPHDRPAQRGRRGIHVAPLFAAAGSHACGGLSDAGAAPDLPDHG